LLRYAHNDERKLSSRGVLSPERVSRSPERSEGEGTDEAISILPVNPKRKVMSPLSEAKGYSLDVYDIES
jgi:hypothetical protein